MEKAPVRSPGHGHQECCVSCSSSRSINRHMLQHMVFLVTFPYLDTYMIAHILTDIH